MGGSEKVQKCADIRYGWSLTSTLFLNHVCRSTSGRGFTILLIEACLKEADSSLVFFSTLMIFHIFHIISGWSQVSSTSGGPGAASTPNLPTSTPKHQAIYVTSSIRPSVSKITSETSLTSSSTSQSHLRSQINGSSSQLSKAEEKIQGRGMCRSSATYGIQQLLQEQVCNWKSFLALPKSFLALPRSFLALRDRFWPCKIIFGLAISFSGLKCGEFRLYLVRKNG